MLLLCKGNEAMLVGPVWVFLVFLSKAPSPVQRLRLIQHRRLQLMAVRFVGIYDAGESQSGGRADDGGLLTLPMAQLLPDTVGSWVPYFKHSYTRRADHCLPQSADQSS